MTIISTTPTTDNNTNSIPLKSATATTTTTPQEETQHAPQTITERLLIYAQSVAFSLLALFTIISLFQALDQVTRSDLRLTETQPTDRCVPFFDDVTKFKDTYPNTRAVYDFRTGEAISRICTNASREEITAVVGADKIYDPWIAQTGCDVLGKDRQLFIRRCERINFQFDDPLTCEGILNITPLPYGAHWNMYAELPEGNVTNETSFESSPYPRCSIRVTRIATIPPCKGYTMEPLRVVDKNVAVVIQIGIAVPFSVLAAEHGWMLSFACRGIPGSFYMFYWMSNQGEDGRGEWPDTYLNFGGWLACAIQDVFEGFAIPLTAIVGCSLDRYPMNLALVILKGMKFVFDFVMFFRNRHKTSEPGSLDEQREVWRKNPKVSEQEIENGLSKGGLITLDSDDEDIL